jgi:hypothetical protein
MEKLSVTKNTNFITYYGEHNIVCISTANSSGSWAVRDF